MMIMRNVNEESMKNDRISIAFESPDNGLRYLMQDCRVRINLPTNQDVYIRLENIRSLCEKFEPAYEISKFVSEYGSITLNLRELEIEWFHTKKELDMALQEKGREILSLLDQLNYSSKIDFVIDWTY